MGPFINRHITIRACYEHQECIVSQLFTRRHVLALLLIGTDRNVEHRGNSTRGVFTVYKLVDAFVTVLQEMVISLL